MTPPPADPEPDDVSPGDEDLVAYLDGEADSESAQRVAAEIARNPTTRAKAESLKKTYDLLDYLPKPEPSPTFTTRTLTKLGEEYGSRPSTPANPTRSPFRIGPWVAAALIAAAIGFVAHRVARTDLGAPADPDLADLPIIDRLPLYAGVDDLDYANRLGDPDLFGEDTDPSAVTIANAAPTPEMRAKRIELFRNYSAARRLQLRTMHRDLTGLPPEDRDRLTGVLEAYAGWLTRLPEKVRKEVLDAPTADARLAVVRQVRNRQWEDALTGPQREKLKLTTRADERVQLVKEWRDREHDRELEWRLAARQWAAIAENRKPWPFSDDALAKEVDAFVKSVFKPDAAVSRLTAGELAKLKSLQAATGQYAAWIPYGAYVLQLAERYPTFPETPTGPPVTEPEHLSPRALAELRNKGGLPKQKYRFVIGKWPEFALAVARDLKDPRPASGDKPLGPCQPGDFAKPIEQFLSAELFPKLTRDEVRKLDLAKGRWPDYPRLMIDLAKGKDLSVPGVTLPGKPSLWTKYYRYTPTGDDRPGEK